MTITPTTLTRAAGVAPPSAGLLFIGVQINHPHLDVALVTTTEYDGPPDAEGAAWPSLSLAGITGMYLRQVKRTGVLGLIGYVVFAVGYLIMLSIEVVGAGRPAHHRRHSSPGYVNDVLAVATGGHATGDIGLMRPLSQVAGVTYLAGGFLFGIALFRARILARWAAALLAVGAVATIAIPLLPQVNYRLFAIPTGVALIGLGYSLWREQRSPTTSRPRAPCPAPAGSPARPGRRQVTIHAASAATRSTGRPGGCRSRWSPSSSSPPSPARCVWSSWPAGRTAAGQPPPHRLTRAGGRAHRLRGRVRRPRRLPVLRRAAGAAGRAGTGRPDGSWSVLGLAVALSALWMTQFYPRQPGTGRAGVRVPARVRVGHGRQHRPRVHRDPPRRRRPSPGLDDPRLRPGARRRHPGVHPGHRRRGLRHQRARPPT